MKAQHGSIGGRSLWALLALGACMGCATIPGPPPSDARVTASLSSVEAAEASRVGDSKAVALRRSAREHYNAATAAMAAGDNRTANLEFGLAEADAQLSQAVARSVTAAAEAQQAQLALDGYQAQHAPPPPPPSQAPPPPPATQTGGQ